MPNHLLSFDFLRKKIIKIARFLSHTKKKNLWNEIAYAKEYEQRNNKRNKDSFIWVLMRTQLKRQICKQLHLLHIDAYCYVMNVNAGGYRFSRNFSNKNKERNTTKIH